MKFFDSTPYPAMYFAHRNAKGEARWVIVTRVTYDIGDQGELTLAAPQPPINFEELSFGDATESAIRHESDLAPEKPRTDLIVNASAHAPDGKPAKRFDVGLAVHEADNSLGAPGRRISQHRLTVTGPRQWVPRSAIARGASAFTRLATLNLVDKNQWSLSEPEPTKAVPLRYDYAFGGTVRLDDAERPHDPPLLFAHPENPLGRGFMPVDDQIEVEYALPRSESKQARQRWASNLGQVQAPQIELPDRPIASMGERYPLCGWGTIPKHWAPRIDKAGTFDEAWFQTRHPLLPTDFDPGYWNGAHPDLQFDRFPEDAVINLWRLVPASRKSDQLLRLHLPGLKRRVEIWDTTNTEPTVRALRMDTVHVDLLNNRLTLLYRLNVADVGSLTSIHLQSGEPS